MTDHAIEQAKAQYESIVELVEALDGDEDSARDAIQEDPLSIQVRSAWCTPAANLPASEYEILLCTGGPACRITGDLDDHRQPSSAKLQWQDWFTPWTDWHEADQDILLKYASVFYYGE